MILPYLCNFQRNICYFAQKHDFKFSRFMFPVQLTRSKSHRLPEFLYICIYALHLHYIYKCIAFALHLHAIIYL